MEPKLSVIIPIRENGDPSISLKSLQKQKTPMEIILSWDKWQNANLARNQGAAFANAPYLLFCDDDIEWRENAIDRMLACLEQHPDAAYVYGAYTIGDRTNCNVEFDAGRLLRNNYISTMSIIRADYFVPFDNSIPRLQDWDVWLTLLEFGCVGVYCGEVIFSTKERDGITRNGKVTYDEAVRIVRAKHPRLFS